MHAEVFHQLIFLKNNICYIFWRIDKKVSGSLVLLRGGVNNKSLKIKLNNFLNGFSDKKFNTIYISKKNTLHIQVKGTIGT